VSSSAAEIDAALARLEKDPSGLTAYDAETLLHVRGEDLPRLLDVAGAVRDEGLLLAGRPGVVTYSRKVFLPLTHLCRDRCHYCVFVQTPGKLAAAGIAPYMDAEEVLRVAREGAVLGCKEALLTLGDRPEDRWEVARGWLSERGYASTLEYVADMARLVLEETGLLPHLNPGVMSWVEMQRLRPLAPSMGMMLETTSVRLWAERSGAHFGSPDKDPAVRLAVLESAGRSRIPFTTGLLLGIGENTEERIESVLALREVQERHGHLQEVIVQNFRAKGGTAMLASPDLQTEEYAAAVAVTRILLGPRMRIQAPPNLTDADELALLLRAGIDDWGGVSPLTPDHVNPERPWPQIDELARMSAGEGFELRERLTTHPPYLREEWVDDRLLPTVLAMADDHGLARDDARLGPFPASVPVAPAPASLGRLLARAAADPAGLDDAAYVQLLHARGEDLDALAALADDVRRSTVGDTVTYAVNRNLDSGLGLPAEQVTELAAEAVALGATEICAQGAMPVPAGYLGFARAVRAADAGLHLHAFRPAEHLAAATAAGISLADWFERVREAGVGSVPGTGARILDDEIRALLTAGQDISSADWIRVVTAAHRAGLPTTATMVYGHVESAYDQVRHLRLLAGVQAETGGFTEVIPMPWVPTESPVPVEGARPGPTTDESRAVHAVARLMLHGLIPHIQAAWTKLGLRGAQRVLAGGVDDLGGVLLDGAIDPAAGPEAGRQLGVDDVRALAGSLGRPVRQRTTTYGETP
jgi:FO synthase